MCSIRRLRYHRRYSDSLRAGRFGVLTVVRAKFSGLIHTGPLAASIIGAGFFFWG